MADIFNIIYNEIFQGTSTSYLIWILFGFIIIVLISRKLSKFKELEDRTRLLFFADLILFPIIIILFHLISMAIDKTNAFSLSFSLFLITAAWFFNRALGLYFWNKQFIEKSGEKAPKLLQNFIALIVYILTFAFILGFIFNKPVTSILVSTGIFATIIGFAMKDLLADIINGISLSIERPYNIGDWIELENGTYLGKVIDIKWRTTRLISRNDSMIVIPNNRCGNMIIHNFSKPNKIYSCNYLISIDSSLSPELVQKQLISGMQDVKNIVKDPSPRAYLADATSEPFQYNIRVWWKNYEYSYFGRDNLFKKITESLNDVGIAQSAVNWQVSKRGFLEEVETKNIKSIDEQVKNVEIFKDFADNEIDSLISKSNTRNFEPNQNIVNENDEGDSLFIILSGNARVYIEKDDKNIKLGLLSPGDAFGEFSLLTGDRRTATVKATNHLQCLEISKNALQNIIENNPSLIDDLALIMAEREQSNKKINDDNKKLSAKEIIDYYKAEFNRKIKSFFNKD